MFCIIVRFFKNPESCMVRKKQNPEETRQALLKAALACFSTRGYSLTTITDIAAKIKLSKGAVYWHFKSKEDLLTALVVETHRAYTPLALLPQAATLDDIKDAFMDWARNISEHKDHRQFLIFLMSRVEWSEALKLKIKRRLESFIVRDPFDELAACLDRFREQGLLTDSLTTPQIVTLFTSVFFGTHRMAFLNKLPIEVLPTLEAGLDMILHKIKE